MVTRALRVLAFLSVLLLLPATAGARLHLITVERGETAISYEGDGETNIPTGYTCPVTNPCTSWGIAYTLHWQASVIVNRLGRQHLRPTGRLTRRCRHGSTMSTWRWRATHAGAPARNGTG